VGHVPTVTAKKTCCKDKPRCKKCPVVLKRLAAAGLAERVDKRTYVVASGVRKADMKAARGPQGALSR
jgi:hypothetical protein